MAVYCTWLLVFWPGVVGNDTLAVLLESDTQGDFRSGKSVLWYYLVHATYGSTKRVEVALLVLLALCALIFARMLSWYWVNGHRRAALLMLLLIGLAPHTVYFLGTLYPDGIFAVAACGLLFELWLCTQRKAVSTGSVLMLALTLPLALFTRANGIAFLLPAIACLWFVRRPDRLKLGALIAASCALGFGAQAVHKPSNQSALDSMVLFETVNFLRPHAMDDLWLMYPTANDPWVLRKPRVTPLTLQTLDAHTPREKLQAFSDPGYWDMLVFHPKGPQFLTLSDAQRQVLRHEFFRHNLWRNVPEFLGSRVTVFFTAALAQGGMPALDWAPNILPATQATSRFRAFELTGAEQVLRKLHRASYQGRWLLWTPFVGIFMAAALLLRRRSTAPARWIGLSLLIQLAGIVALSSAGEYRYLLVFFVAPLALWPMFSSGPPAGSPPAAR